MFGTPDLGFELKFTDPQTKRGIDLFGFYRKILENQEEFYTDEIWYQFVMKRLKYPPSQFVHVELGGVKGSILFLSLSHNGSLSLQF
jgi:hypothetical protein